MGRRKVVFYGRGLNEKYESALGFLEGDGADEGNDDLQNKPIIGIPVLDWERISNVTDVEIPSYAKEKINFFFTSEVGYRLRNHLHGYEDEENEFGDSSFSEFLKKYPKLKFLQEN